MASRKPNVIVVLTDDQGFGQLPVYSDAYPDDLLFLARNTKRYECDRDKAREAARASMPNLQKLAGNGVTFMNAFVTSPLCAPSRAGLITGRYQQRFGIYHNDDIGNAGVPVSETMLPELFQNSGYRTAMIGKWHLGKMEPFHHLPLPTRESYAKRFCGCPAEYHPLNRGFDHFFGFNGCGTSYYNSPCLFRGFEHVEAKGYTTEEFTDEAIAFMESSGDDPFFVYLAYNAVHTPLLDPAPERYRRFDTGNPEVDNYYAYLAAVDDGLGKIVSSLEARGELDNTLIFYLSDNGAVIDSPQPMNGPFRGYKGIFRHGGVHVPMVVHWPAGLSPSTYEPCVASLDVIPTALAAAGIERPDNLDGVDLVPHIKAGSNPHEALYWAGPETMAFAEENEEFWETYWHYLTEQVDEIPKHMGLTGDASWAIQKDNWLLRCNERTGQEELFDTSADAGERKDLASSQPEVVASLRTDFKRWSSDLPEPLSWKDKDGYERIVRDSAQG